MNVEHLAELREAKRLLENRSFRHTQS